MAFQSHPNEIASDRYWTKYCIEFKMLNHITDRPVSRGSSTQTVMTNWSTTDQGDRSRLTRMTSRSIGHDWPGWPDDRSVTIDRDDQSIDRSRLTGMTSRSIGHDWPGWPVYRSVTIDLDDPSIDRSRLTWMTRRSIGHDWPGWPVDRSVTIVIYLSIGRWTYTL